MMGCTFLIVTGKPRLSNESRYQTPTTTESALSGS
jgi:hypothetical protein